MSRLTKDMPKKKTAKKVAKKPSKRAKKKIIGAVAMRVRRGDEELDTEDSQVEVYISFGRYDEKSGTDGFGVDDKEIFYYAKNEAELRRLCSKSRKVNKKDFFLLEYWLVEDLREEYVRLTALMKTKTQTEILQQIVNDWRSYVIGAGSSYPPDQAEYELFFQRMVQNVEDAEANQPSASTASIDFKS
jgi:hypothetical protein